MVNISVLAVRDALRRTQIYTESVMRSDLSPNVDILVHIQDIFDLALTCTDPLKLGLD